MSNLLSTLRALIVGAPKASIEQPLPIVGLPLGFGPPPLEVTRRKYARSPLKVRGGRARTRTATRDPRGWLTTNAFANVISAFDSRRSFVVMRPVILTLTL